MSVCHLPIYDSSKCTFFALGRNAIYAACQAFKLKPGDEVLTPAFDCDGSLQPFRVLGLSLKFFRSNPYTFSVDMDDLRKRFTSKTKLLHIINHFGFPQPWDELLSLREEFGVPILEDNAYSLFSTYNGKHFGTFGDISVFSLRKNLPLIDGGLMRINNPKYVELTHQKKAKLLYKTEFFSALNLLSGKLGVKKISLLRSVMSYFKPEINSPPPLYSNSTQNVPGWPLRDHIGEDFTQDYLRPMSKLALYQLSLYSAKDYCDLASRKRESYIYLVQELESIKSIKILWSQLPIGIVPFNISFLVEKNRDVVFEKLGHKYSMMAWPTLPQAVLEQLESFPEVKLLGKQLLQINHPFNFMDGTKKLIFFLNNTIER